jgi:hypothetical protein
VTDDVILVTKQKLLSYDPLTPSQTPVGSGFARTTTDGRQQFAGACYRCPSRRL